MDDWRPLRSAQQKCPIPVAPGNHSEYQNIVPSILPWFPEPEEYTTLYDNYEGNFSQTKGRAG
jgi:hypothetical protein